MEASDVVTDDLHLAFDNVKLETIWDESAVDKLPFSRKCEGLYVITAGWIKVSLNLILSIIIYCLSWN